jgi:hypothetical protein
VLIRTALVVAGGTHGSPDHHKEATRLVCTEQSSEREQQGVLGPVLWAPDWTSDWRCST